MAVARFVAALIRVSQGGGSEYCVVVRPAVEVRALGASTPCNVSAFNNNNTKVYFLLNLR